jgi:hypothetical protein
MSRPLADLFTTRNHKDTTMYHNDTTLWYINCGIPVVKRRTHEPVGVMGNSPEGLLQTIICLLILNQVAWHSYVGAFSSFWEKSLIFIKIIAENWKNSPDSIYKYATDSCKQVYILIIYNVFIIYQAILLIQSDTCIEEN